VCTAFYSPAVNASIGTALVEAPLAVPSTRLRIYEDGCQGALREATVVPLPFYPIANRHPDRPDGTNQRRRICKKPEIKACES
jgi:glycine cleavage system aminomethyltransferase T